MEYTPLCCGVSMDKDSGHCPECRQNAEPTLVAVEPYAQRGGTLTFGEFAMGLFFVLVLLAAWSAK